MILTSFTKKFLPLIQSMKKVNMITSFYKIQIFMLRENNNNNNNTRLFFSSSSNNFYSSLEGDGGMGSILTF